MGRSRALEDVAMMASESMQPSSMNMRAHARVPPGAVPSVNGCIVG